MAYSDVVEMASSSSLMNRCIAAVAAEDEPEPIGWVANNMWHLAASPGWADAWHYAHQALTVNANPDLGERDDVISDAMILSGIQARMNELATP